MLTNANVQNPIALRCIASALKIRDFVVEIVLVSAVRILKKILIKS